ncbi:YhgE/Pip family protein [Lacticaseibacillus absianus]|uniref:YhgE/Pip family protein n=1 Tax=Lacticaseibacillus absianus TaxID=2729623 RepID=UPI0015C940D9|nr:YhgE/Pip domain-containing protein [Lacticaseibacillus absianus]
MILFKHEFRSIAKNKGLMAAMLVILFIPFAYSFCFLTSAWDPYGNTGKIPVAVVNLDEPAKLQGKTIHAGRDTIAQLHDDKQLKWVFCTPEQAKKGLADNKYYTVVTFPKNFSANAATLMDAHPKQMELTYKTNGSLNYVSEIISQVGADKLNSQIREKVTTAFAVELFDQIKTIGKQIKTASDGATKITAGQTQLNDGLTQLHDNVPTLSDGVTQLADGGTQLYTGLGQLNGKVPALVGGVSQLTAGSGQVTDGLGQLNKNVPALKTGVQQLNAGGSQLNVGLGQLNAQVPTLASGVTKLNGGINELATKVGTEPDSGDQSKLTSGVRLLKNGINELYRLTLTSRDDNPDMPTGVAMMKAGMDKLVSAVQNQNTLISTSFMQVDMGLPTVAGVTAEDIGLPAGSKLYPLYHFEKATTAATKQSKTDLDSLEAAVTASGDAAAQAALDQFKQSYVAEQEANQEGYSTVKAYLNYAKTSIGDKTYDAQGDPKGLLNAVQIFQTKLTTLDNELSHPDQSGHDTYKSAVQQLQVGLTQLDDSVNGASDKSLMNGVAQLKAGMNQLYAAVPTLKDGVSQLYAGSGRLATGLNQLNGKTPALASGVSQLYAGSGQVTAGLGQLNGQTPVLSSGVAQLYTGSGQLNAGLKQLNGQVPTLASGVNQLYDGSGKLVAANTQLSDGLSAGYEQIARTKLTKLTAKMFAAPSKDVQLKYSSVKNYGAALAPYVLALALFIAIIIFNFAYPMKREADDDRAPLQWLLSKLAVGTGVAVAAGLIEAGLMLAMMHLPVDHVAGFFGITLLFALAAQYLTMMLNIAFGRAGIFVALGLLTLSGSGGLFPAETISPLYESTQKFLPLTYAINGYREMITSGINAGTVATSVVVLLATAVISLALMIPATMMHMKTPAHD